MHNFRLSILVGILGLAPQAFGVTMANCPDKITITAKNVHFYDQAELEKIYNDETTPSFDEAVSLRVLFEYSGTERFLKQTLNLVRTTNSQCGYRDPKNPEPDTDGSSETRFYTTDGEDLLRIAVRIGQDEDYDHVWIYCAVTEYSKAGLNCSAKSANIRGYFDHGAPRAVFGKVYGLTAK